MKSKNISFTQSSNRGNQVRNGYEFTLDLVDGYVQNGEAHNSTAVARYLYGALKESNEFSI